MPKSKLMLEEKKGTPSKNTSTSVASASTGIKSGATQVSAKAQAVADKYGTQDSRYDMGNPEFAKTVNTYRDQQKQKTIDNLINYRAKVLNSKADVDGDRFEYAGELNKQIAHLQSGDATYSDFNEARDFLADKFDNRKYDRDYTKATSLLNKSDEEIDSYIADMEARESDLSYGHYTDSLGEEGAIDEIKQVQKNIKTAKDYREARQVLDEWEVGDYNPEDIITAKNGEFQFIDFDEGIKDVDAQIRTLQAEVGKSMNVEEQIALTARINELNNQREELKARKDYQDKFLISSELEGYMNEGDEDNAREIASLVSSHDDKLGERMLKTSASALVGFVNTPLQVIDASRDYIAELTGEDFDIRDKNNLSTRLNDLSRRLSNESLYGTNDVERIIVQITNSTVNQLARLPLGEAGSLITMSLQSGGENYRENREMGYSHLTSLASAVANGIISYKVEQIGWEGLNNIIGSRAVNFSVGDYMHTLLTSSLSEGAEEVIEHFVDAWADELIHADYLDENGQIDWNKTAQGLADTLKTSTDPKELWNAFYMGYLGGIALEGIVATPGFIQTKMQYNAYQRFRQNALEMMANDMFSTTKNGDNLSEYEAYEAYINMVDAGLRNYDSTSLTGKAIQLFSDTVAPMTSVQESVNALKESLTPTAERQAVLRVQHTQMLSNYAKYLAMAQESLDAQGIDMSIEEFASLSSKSRETVARVARIQKATGINQRMVATLDTMVNGYNAKDRATMKGEIVLNANRENYRDVATALAHENLHTIEETAEGLKIADLIRSEYSAEEWKQMVNHKRLSYYNSFNNMALQALENGSEASAEQYRNDAQDFLDNDIGFKNAEHEVVAELFSEKRNAEKLANQMAMYNTSGAYRMFNNLRAKVMKTDTDVQIANAFLQALKKYGIFGENATIDMDAQTEAENTRGLATIDYSLNHNEEIIEAQQKYAKKKGYAGVDPKVFETAQQQMADFARIMREAMAKNPNVVPLETDANLGEVLIKDASYGVSVENWTKCIRALAYDEIVNFVSDKIGRPLNVEESFLVSQMLYDIAVDPQCLYCYVALDRKSYNEMVLRYIDQRDELIKKYEAEGKPEISEQNIKALRRLLERKETEGVAEAVDKIPLFKEFLEGRKVTLPMLDRFADWITMYNNGEHLISKRDVATDLDRDRIANGNDASLKKQLDDLSKYAQGASWAKKDYGFRAYFDEIRKLSKKMVEKLNKHYGLRWYSFNDYTPAYILENMQQFTDASLRGLKGLAYTKDTDFAEIFAPTGCNINISVYVRAFKNENGEMEYRIDENQSANLEKAIELRNKYKNVGIVVTATSDEAVTWALEQEWSDVVIPFHIVRSGGKIAEAYKWTVYNASQADKVNDKEMWENYVASLGKKSASKMVYPSEHQNDYDKFMEICKSRGLTPRFSQFIEILSQLHPNDDVWKKNYMKLVNETRQSEAETQPIQPIFDMESAKRSWEWFEAKGGFYEGWYKPGTDITKAVDTIVKDVEAIERGEKTFQDIEYGERRAEWDDLMNSKRIREFMRQHGRQHGRSVEPSRYSLNTDSDGRELSEEQKKYFKNTKVVDAEGNLQVTYHGTPNVGFTEYDTNRLGSTTGALDSRLGFHFTDNKDLAELFTEKTYDAIYEEELQKVYEENNVSDDSTLPFKMRAELWEEAERRAEERALDNERGEIKEQYLNITKPLDLSNLSNLTAEERETLVGDLNYIATGDRDAIIDDSDIVDDLRYGLENEMGQFKDEISNPESIARMKELGYDGMIMPIQKTDADMLARLGLNTKGKEYITFDSNQAKNTDNLNPTDSNDIRYSLQDDDDYGYHYGAKDFDYNFKSETLWQRSGRHSGAFGTGTYFFGEGRLNEPSFTGKRTEHKVDFSDYNLFKPKTNSDAFKLHDFFKSLDDNYRYQGIQTRAEYDEKLNSIINELDNFDIDNTIMTPIQVDEYRNRLLELEDEDDVDGMIEEASLGDGEPNAWDLAYGLQRMQRRYTRGMRRIDNIEEMHEQIPNMARLLGTSAEQLQSIIDNAMETARADSKKPGFVGGNYDSVGTRVMKALGYDGIDVRHLDRLDNSTYGSVIYDLKPETVRYSLSDDGQTIPEEVQNQLDADSLAEVDAINKDAKKMARRQSILTKKQQESFERISNYDKDLVPTGDKATLDEVESDVKDMIKNDRIKDIKKNGFVESDAEAWEQHNKEVDEEIKNITSHTTSVEDANDNLKGIARILDEKPELKSPTAKEVWKKYRDWFVREFVDHGRAVYRLAKEVKDPLLYALYDYSQNVDNIVGRMFANKRVDLHTGEVIGKGFDEIFAPIRDSGLSREFQNYMYHKLNIDRMTLSDRFSTEFTDEDGKISFLTLPNKPVFNEVVTAKMSQEFCDRMEAEHPEFLEWAKDVYEYEDAELRMLVKSGRLSQEQMNILKERYPHYVPISREMDMKPFVTDEQVVSSNRAIKKATGGTANINPLEYAMQKHSRDVYSTILNNDLYWRIGQYYEMPVDAEFEQDTDYKIDTMGNEVQPAQGENPPTLIYYENGERYVIEIDQDLYDALLPRNFAPDLPFVSGVSNLRRNLITGWNPVFMFTNGIKDFQDAQFNTRFSPIEYNSAYVQAWNEIVNNGKLYQMYLNLGGEYNSYFRNDDGKVEGKSTPILSKVIALNEKVEIAPRLAEFICSLKHDMSTAEAMYNASDITTNFKRGGRTAKWMNRNGFTFLNASIQGFDKQIRNITDAKDKEGWKGVAKYMAKLSIANAIPLVILNGLVWDDDDEYAELSDYIKQNYYIIGKYGEGKFIRIPKGRIASFYQTVMENAVNNDERKSMWDNLMNDLADDMESFMNNVAPNNPIDNNLLSPLIQAHTNTAWYGDDIVPTRLQDERPSEQYDDSTDALSRAIGQFSRKVAEETGSSLFELSPYKINYLLDQYTGMVGDIGLPMLTPRAENRIDNHILSGFANPLLDKFTTDSTLKNQRVTDFYAMKEELNKLASSSEATEEQILASKFMNSVSGEMSQLYKDKRAIQSDTSIPNSEKFDEARNIQEQIIELAKKGLTGYDQIDIRGENATVGDTEYKKSSGGDWAKTKTRDFSGYYSTYGLDEDKQSQFKSAMEVTSKKDENGKTIRNSEALATRKALEEMGEYENVLKYIEENGLEYKDFDLNKTVVGYDESKFNDKYNAVYETEEASAEPKSTSYTPRRNTSQNGSNDSEEDFFSTLLSIINAPVSTSRSGLSANVAQVFKEGRQRSKSIRSNRDDLRKAIAKAKRKYNL